MAKAATGKAKDSGGFRASGTAELGPGDRADFVPRVQGIDSSIRDLNVFDKKWIAEVTSAVEDATLERTMDGASSLKLVVADPERVLLESEMLANTFDTKLDGLGFTYVAVDFQGALEPLELTFEDSEVARMRIPKGPIKVSRDKVTRAEFARRLVRKIKPTIPFFCPSLHVRQPIATSAQGRQNQNGKLARREQGLSGGAKITVKGAQADGGQIRTIERALDAAMSINAPEKALIAVVMCITQESNAGKDSANLYQQNASWPGSPNDVENATQNFLKRAPTYPGGFLRWLDRNASGDLGAGVQAIQASAYPGAYSRWHSEATNTVKTYLGGASGSTSTQPTADTAKYAFERKKDESTWDCLQRLASEVGWRCFVSAGVCYFVAETDLLRSKVRAHVTDSTPGVEDTSFTMDKGQPVDEFTITARARAWGCPPGCVVSVEKHGPANGLWLVSKISSKLRVENTQASITLKRAVAPLPEPAGATTTSKGKGKGVRSGGLPAKVQKVDDRMNQLAGWHIPYVWGGGHGGFSDHPRGLDCSGAVCDALHAAGLIDSPVVSGALAHWGAAGPGEFITVYANAQHVWMEIKVGGDWKPWGTSVGDSGHGGLGFHPTPSASYKAQYTKRHPQGL